MSKHLVSILMSVRNAEPYLVSCLESIIRQTETNWELLVINNHSTDNSLRILKAFAEKESRFTLRNNPGNSLIEALRNAYSLSSGGLITRMDADDIMPPEKIEILKNILIKKGSGYLATGKVKYFSDGNLGEGYRKYESWLNALMSHNRNFTEIYKECVIPSPCWMISREDFEICGAYWAETYPEDYDLCFRFYKYGIKVEASDKILHHWRDYSDRASRTMPEYANLRFIELKIRYFLELDYDPEKELVVWGAGSKGKLIARYLVKEKIPFTWVTNNTRKINASIYDVSLKNFNDLNGVNNFQAIIAVASPGGQSEITSFLLDNEKVLGLDYFFFC